MNAADFAILSDDHGDVAIICPRCNWPTYAPLEDDVTLGLLIRLASQHAAAHEPQNAKYGYACRGVSEVGY